MRTNSNIIIGIDEVGRGPWAGPLLVSAVALDMSQSYEGLADSKKLTKHRRELLSPYIKQRAAGIGLGWVDVSELDRLGMAASLRLGAQRAYEQLSESVREQAAEIVIDGNTKMLTDERSITLVKADAKVQAVSAASIVAKVARDSYMTQLGRLFPDYGFEKHAGYGTKHHSEALQLHGVIDGVHRRSFAPIRRLLGLAGDVNIDAANHPVELTIGRQAEHAAADYLRRNGYDVISQNWRTKTCEIDIVARRDRAIYFVEVKYRRSDESGDGLAAITATKLAQMKYAAKVYLQLMTRQTSRLDPHLLAISMSGDPPTVNDLVEITW